MATTYTFYRNDQRETQFEFDPEDPSCLDDQGYAYMGRVFNLAHYWLSPLDLDIFVTGWTVHELPRYGERVVSFILQDEWGRLPPYFQRVGATFKTCGLFPFSLDSYGYGGPLDFIANFMAQTKALSMDKGNHLRRVLTQKKFLIPNIYELPLGYYGGESHDYIPFEDRNNDLFFAGSLKHTNKPLQFPRPKELARKRMIEALERVDQLGQFKVQRNVTPGFGESISSNRIGYVREMMNTRFCPIPRGANVETYRFYEAIRFGCIPVGEAFPNSTYYEGAPIIRLKSWSNLPEIITQLMNDRKLMLELHQNSLNWWKEFCSELATAKYIINILKQRYEK